MCIEEALDEGFDYLVLVRRLRETRPAICDDIVK